jgi:membrane protein YqaA with SNARE-associated domain
MHIPTWHGHVTHASHHTVKWLRSKYAGSILAAISFAESLFLPVLIDPFLVALILARRSRWLYYTTISIIASLLGGLVAYFIGLWFFDSFGRPLLEFYNLQGQFASMSVQINDSGFIFVLIGALTPIPYKIVALASGFGQINIVTFLLASLFGRILRLGLVGYVAYAVGPHALPMFRKHLLSLAYVFLVLLLTYLVFQWAT